MQFDWPKNPKSVILGSFEGNFRDKFGGKCVFLEKGALPVFKYFNHLSWCKNSEKTNKLFLIKIPNCWLTDRERDRQRETENSDFMGPSLDQRSKKAAFKTTLAILVIYLIYTRIILKASIIENTSQFHNSILLKILLIHI